MTKNYTRMLRTFIIMLCVCAYLDAALNYVHNETSDVTPAGEQLASKAQSEKSAPAPAKPSLSTQVDLPPIETPIAPVQENKTPAKTTRIAAPLSAEDLANDDETIEFYFEDADIQNLLNQIASLYNVIFITDDMVMMADGKMIEGKKAPKGNKLSFKTHKPLTKKAAWDIFLTFLEISGFTLTTESKPNIYRVVPLASPLKVPIPSFIGTKPEELPTNDQMIRYVYFIQNTTLTTIFPILDALRSTASSLIQLTDMQAFMITDKAYNIVSLMDIVTELDRVAMPQSMSVLKLKRAEAKEVKELYEKLTGTEKDAGVASRLFQARKQPTATYFPENVRIISYDRTNALILLGPEDAIRKIEEFITQHVDVEITAPYPPIRVHNLRYANAKQIADIMNSMTKIGEGSAAGTSGGVRGEDKFIKKMTFTPEPVSNRLIIEGDEEDYLMAKEILNKLDEQQPQIAVEALLLSVSINDSQQLGSQIRSKVPGADGLLGNTVKFQTSGLYGTAGIQVANPATPPTSTGANRLLANLINLAIGAPAGNTIVSLGSDMFGVWGLLQALQSVTNTQIIATPFLVATNKTKATVTVGQTRRVTVATVVATTTANSQDDKPANVILEVTPQINSDGMIILDLNITVDQFADPTNFTSATVNTKKLKTNTVVSNGEVLALGGLIQNSAQLSISQTPILGRIPILGWLFKNRQDAQQRNNLLVLMCARILPPESTGEADKFTQNRILAYHTSLADMVTPTTNSDPINKFFFERKSDSTERIMENFMFDRQEEQNKKQAVKPEKKRLENNQRARKRSSRNRFASSEPDSQKSKSVTETKAATSTPEPAAPAPATTPQMPLNPLPPEHQASAESVQKSLKRSPQRTRPALSSFLNETNSEEVAS